MSELLTNGVKHLFSFIEEAEARINEIVEESLPEKSLLNRTEDANKFEKDEYGVESHQIDDIQMILTGIQTESFIIPRSSCTSLSTHAVRSADYCHELLMDHAEKQGRLISTELNRYMLNRMAKISNLGFRIIRENRGSLDDLFHMKDMMHIKKIYSSTQFVLSNNMMNHIIKVSDSLKQPGHPGPDHELGSTCNVIRYPDIGDDIYLYSTNLKNHYYYRSPATLRIGLDRDFIRMTSGCKIALNWLDTGCVIRSSTMSPPMSECGRKSK